MIRKFGLVHTIHNYGNVTKIGIDSNFGIWVWEITQYDIEARSGKTHWRTRPSDESPESDFPSGSVEDITEFIIQANVAH